MNREAHLSTWFSVVIFFSIILCPILSLLFTEYSLYFLSYQLLILFIAIVRVVYLTLKIRKLEREQKKLIRDVKAIERFEEIFGVDYKDVLK